MAQEFLSQDEVDALLDGVPGEDKSPKDEGGVREYDLAKQERIVRGRMPTLEIIHERFARLLRIGIFNFMRRSPELSLSAPRVVKYSEFVRSLVVPTNINIVQLKPLRGSALFIMDPVLVFGVVDNMFGSDGRFHTRVEGRDFTPTEMRIIQGLLAVILENYRKSWAPVHAINFEYLRSEMHTQFASVASPNEIVIATTNKVELGSAGGDLHICIPYSSVEPIRDLLYSSMQGDQMEPDKRWLHMLQRQVQIADVELTAKLAKIPVRVRDLVNMKVGDVIGFDLPEIITAEVDGVPVFECRYGALNGQYALKVERIVANQAADNAAGDTHVH